ncbi:oligosaccharide flippase family protein [Acidianus sulfidivorans JP7]|uniref:Polysaccharide biosynthesis protein n=1 Tax=Acidianus sulfidivorans JP7 TaxID=619593 RepID=A0A2U9IQ73_9CREN|nr:lipopolysaccharide biosynthesis protein [Acidianus sulfidivorans]AWR98171.1 oligosaccharide flippase family protein [Acidianus sulfidivorans JP7]
MNPIVNALKNLSVTTVNVIVALIFFIITAKITNPSFFGKVAIIQLLEVITTSFFALLNSSIITREVSYMYAKKEINKRFISTVLLTPLVISPSFLILLLFPNYVKLAIPYLILYLYNMYSGGIMYGLNKYTENAISGIAFLVIRWVVSIIAVLQHNIYLLVEIWLIGGIFSTTFNTIMINKAVRGLQLSFYIEYFKKIFKEGLVLYLSSVSGFLAGQGDRVTTAYLLGSYYLGIYQFAALVASVPNMIIGGVSGVILPSASYYKALGKDELSISRLSFKVISLLTFLLVILAVPFAYYLIPKLFPDYQSGIYALIILLLATTLPQPIGVLTTFLIAFKKSLRPYLYLSFINATSVLLTSYLLIPRIGIIGGAISQLIVAILSSSFTLYYVISNRVFHPTRREMVILSMIPLLFAYELFIDPPFLDFILLIMFVLFFKLGRVFSQEEKKIIVNFSPSLLKKIINFLL